MSTLLSEPKSQTVGVYERLRADVLSGRLAPAQRLKIADLCQQIGVSLGVVREALSRLAAEGLVTAEPQRGFQVAPISPDDLIDLTTARVEIECACLRRSIERGDLVWESQLVAAFHQLSRTPEHDDGNPDILPPDWALAHGRFHEALVVRCDSLWLLRQRRALYEQAERYRQLSKIRARHRDVAAEHKGVFDAALARDIDLAAALLTRHIQITTQSLLDTPLLNV